ncbi:MAG: hypothetical protein OXR66_02455 [Candidatus Woesearchaeota archaeon]|nr:hypothetical protein [Candidatus Woesearchaeota archaeon]
MLRRKKSIRGAERGKPGSTAARCLAGNLSGANAARMIDAALGGVTGIRAEAHHATIHNHEDSLRITYSDERVPAARELLAELSLLMMERDPATSQAAVSKARYGFKRSEGVELPYVT